MSPRKREDGNVSPSFVGTNVRRLRMQAEMSQSSLAKAAGVHRVTISGIEIGDHDPSVSSLLRIAAALGVSAGDLLGEPRRCPTCNQYWYDAPEEAES